MREIAEYFRTDWNEYSSLLLGHIGISLLAVILAVIMTTIFGINLLTGCGASATASGSKIKVASKDFTENEIVAEVYALALEDAGLEVERVFDVESAVIHTSLISDEIDIYPEYTGTGLLSVLGKDLITDPESEAPFGDSFCDSRYQALYYLNNRYCCHSCNDQCGRSGKSVDVRDAHYESV